MKYTFGHVSVDASARTIVVAAEPVHLTRQAFDVRDVRGGVTVLVGGSLAGAQNAPSHSPGSVRTDVTSRSNRSRRSTREIGTTILTSSIAPAVDGSGRTIVFSSAQPSSADDPTTDLDLFHAGIGMSDGHVDGGQGSGPPLRYGLRSSG